MAEIKYEDEDDLQRKIRKILNKQGFHFEIVPHTFDLVDKVRKTYIEVKPEDFAPAQILYGIAKEGLKDVVYIGLACAFEVRFYKSPSFEVILDFAKKIDSSLSIPPSNVKKKEWHDEGFLLLGNHWKIYTYKGELNLDESTTEIFVDKENYEYFKQLFEKYNIDPSRFLTYIADIYAKNQEIKVNNDGWIINTNTGKFFHNTDREQRGIEEYIGRRDYSPIRDFRDKTLFESMKIRGNDVNKILHQIDRLEPIKSRRFRGRFFTKDKIGEEISKISEAIKPDYIIEPYVGAGTLIESLVEQYKGAMNDINKGFIDILEKKYNGRGWMFTYINTITTPYEVLFKQWKIPKNKTVLILTNPPFGTSATNILVSKKGEIKDGNKSRKVKIDYGGLGDIYGRGDLVIPAIGKLIEIIKKLKGGYIATFSPAGVMLGRVRYNKLLKALLRDFEFLEGHIFSGKEFNSVSSKKAISFTVWKYNKNINTDIESLTFMCENELLQLKRMNLLKDGWKYNEGIDGNEIGTTRNDTFNNPNPKMIKLELHRAGSQMVERNVKIDLHILNVPSELAYGLWSICVGLRSITVHPNYIDNANTHLPDFSKRETLEILAYAVIHILITELKVNYCEGKVGFIGMQRIFRFGGDRLTKGAKYLIEKYKNCSIGEKTISDVFNELKDEPNIDNINENYRKMIKKEIEKRLEIIGYWDYIPIPKSF